MSLFAASRDDIVARKKVSAGRPETVTRCSSSSVVSVFQPAVIIKGRMCVTTELVAASFVVHANVAELAVAVTSRALEMIGGCASGAGVEVATGVLVAVGDGDGAIDDDASPAEMNTPENELVLPQTSRMVRV